MFFFLLFDTRYAIARRCHISAAGMEGCVLDWLSLDLIFSITGSTSQRPAGVALRSVDGGGREGGRAAKQSHIPLCVHNIYCLTFRSII